MSLVGPRPDLEYSRQHYQPRHGARFGVLPGMTGLWQVSGRSRVSVLEMLELDIRYVDNWSLWLDLKILAKTLPAVLSRRGSGV
jgi:lipopolysaccharide/colanic/teichoic acid biosynthesis glycosyltransferase